MPRPRVLAGLDVLLERGLDELQGHALAVLAGSGTVTQQMIPTASALLAVPSLRIAALFGPEHGVRGEEQAGVHVDSTRDAATGLPVYSLYGEHREPTAAMLEGIETIIIDLQDVGLRYYTYASTVHAVLRAAARQGTGVVLLDRPNPLDGTSLEGPITEPAFQSFVSTARVPIRHGLTLGELAGWINVHEGIGADLRVVPMAGWQREFRFADTGLPWAAPSPNLPSPWAGVAYTATCLIEGTSMSEGRGTAQPFEIVGAPWIDAEMLARHLNGLDLPGVRFRPTWFRPNAGKYTGEVCAGVQLHLEDQHAFAGLSTGLHLLATIRRLYPEQLHWSIDPSGAFYLDLLLGTGEPRLAIERGEAVADVVESWQPALQVFAAEREAFLLYGAPRRTVTSWS